MTAEKQNKKFNDEKFLLFDQEQIDFHPAKDFAPFALTDALIAHAGKHEQASIHFWQTKPLAILGMMDTRISNFKKALQVFDQEKHRYIVRNSGGLGIISDPGVLNVSLIYPNKDNLISIEEGYQLMLDFLRQTFYHLYPDKIKAYEITNSYCFGSYDLSIEGKKIAGIAQRRIKNGVAIMMYLSVYGKQEKRAELMKIFYEVGLDGNEPIGRYPDVHPQVMTTLADVYETYLPIEGIKYEMLKHFSYEEGKITEEMQKDFQEALEKMKERNARVFGADFVTNYLKE